MGILLLAVHIECYNLSTRTAYGVWDADSFVRAIATFGYRLRKIEAACERKSNNLYTHIALFGLFLSCCRVSGGRFHIDVRSADLQIFGKVKRIATLAHILDGVMVHGDRAAFHFYLNGSFLTSGCAFFVTAAILVVVGVCKLCIATFLDDQIVNR